MGYPEDWDVLLTDVFHKSWPLASDPSQQMRLMAMAVDSGGEDGVTDNAYKFWRRCRRDGLGKRIYLFKGDSIRRAKLITRTFPDNTGRTGRRAQAAGDVPLWLLQTDALKDRVNNALWRDSPGPGYVHFPDWLGSWFYDELTYEERSSDGKWSKPGRGANEAFDLMVYAEALVILHGYEKIRWPDAPESCHTRMRQVPVQPFRSPVKVQCLIMAGSRAAVLIMVRRRQAKADVTSMTCQRRQNRVVSIVMRWIFSARRGVAGKSCLEAAPAQVFSSPAQTESTFMVCQGQPLRTKVMHMQLNWGHIYMMWLSDRTAICSRLTGMSMSSV